MERKEFTNNLTTGNVWKQLLVFAIPFFISNLIQSAYGVVDTMILGHFSGTESISAVNTGGSVIVIVTNIAAGLSMGGTVMIGQYLGANQPEKIKKSISTLLVTLFAISIICSGILLCLADTVLQGMNTPVESYQEAKSYLVINLVGLIFVYGYNALSAIMRGLGDSKTPLKYVLIASVVNIILDLILVGIFHTGATGAALATIIAQGVSMILCILHLKRHDFLFDFKLRSFTFHTEYFVTLLKVGLPNAINLVATNFSFLILTSMLNETGGVIATAASGIVFRFNSFCLLPSTAISASASAMISQNAGAGKPERITVAMRYCFLLCLAVNIVVFAIANLCPEQIFLLFGAEEALVTTGTEYLHTFSFEYAFLPFIVSFYAVFNGTGNGWITMVTDVIASFFVRIPMAYVMSTMFDFGIAGIGACVPAATCTGTILACIFFLSGVWKKNMIIQTKEL